MARRTESQLKRLHEVGFQQVGQRDGCHNCRHLGKLTMYGPKQSKAHVYCARHEVETSKFAICWDHEKERR